MENGLSMFQRVNGKMDLGKRGKHFSTINFFFCLWWYVCCSGTSVVSRQGLSGKASLLVRVFKMTNSILIRIVSLASLSLFLVSCGGSKAMVKDVQVSTEYVDNDVHLTVSANLSIGNVVLPSSSLPIYMPKTWEEIGNISMTSAIGGQNYMEIDVNLSSVAHLQASQASLPNGSVLPLIATNKVITIPVGKGAELYLTIADGVAAIGAAIPFKSFDSMGAKIGTSSLFPVFNIQNVLGAAGIYTSKQAGKNGFGLFVDLSSVLDPVDFVDIGLADASRSMKSARVMQAQSSASLNLSSIKPSSRKERRLNRELLRMHNRRRRLQLH